jgi:hypothetical protein
VRPYIQCYDGRCAGFHELLELNSPSPAPASPLPGSGLSSTTSRALSGLVSLASSPMLSTVSARDGSYGGGLSSSPPSTHTLSSSRSISVRRLFHSSTLARRSRSSASSFSTEDFSVADPMRVNSHSSPDSPRPRVRRCVWYRFREARVDIVMRAEFVSPPFWKR